MADPGCASQDCEMGYGRYCDTYLILRRICDESWRVVLEEQLSVLSTCTWVEICFCSSQGSLHELRGDASGDELSFLCSCVNKQGGFKTKSYLIWYLVADKVGRQVACLG
jgi:hypothetical protein